MTGRILSGTEAHALRLVTRVTDAPLEQARALAAEIATRSPDAVAAAKFLLQESWHAGEAEALAAERKWQRRVIAGRNQRIAVRRNAPRSPEQPELPFRAAAPRQLTAGAGDDALSAPARAPGPRLHHAPQPRADGLHAHGARGPGQQLPAPGRLLRRAGAGRRRADRDGRLRAQRRGLAAALCLPPRVPRRGPGPPAGHRRRARRRREDRAADPARGPLRLSPAVRRRLGHPVAHHAVQAPGPVDRGRRAADPRLRPVRRPGPGGGLRRRGGDGLGGLLHQPVPGDPHQPAHRQVGRQLRQPHAAARRDRHPGPGGGRAATSSSSTACPCST